MVDAYTLERQHVKHVFLLWLSVRSFLPLLVLFLFFASFIRSIVLSYLPNGFLLNVHFFYVREPLNDGHRVARNWLCRGERTWYKTKRKTKQKKTLPRSRRECCYVVSSMTKIFRCFRVVYYGSYLRLVSVNGIRLATTCCAVRGG